MGGISAVDFPEQLTETVGLDLIRVEVVPVIVRVVHLMLLESRVVFIHAGRYLRVHKTLIKI